MALNTHTIAWLKKIKENFSDISQGIFKETYLTPYAHKTYQPIYRPYHGAQHASRVAALVRILINICRTLGYPEEIISLSEEEITLLQLVAIFHDAGRRQEGPDLDEEASATLFENFLKENGVDDSAALKYAEYINHKRLGEIAALFESADAIDISRVRQYVLIEKIPFFAYVNPSDRELFLKLVFEVAESIKLQGDLSADCGIYLYGEELYFLEKNYDPEVKQKYEHHPFCYNAVIENFKHSTFLRGFYNDNKRMPCEEAKNAAMHFFSETEIDQFDHLLEFGVSDQGDIVLSFSTETKRKEMLAIIYKRINFKTMHPPTIKPQEWKKLINLLRQAREPWQPPGDFYIKVVRPTRFESFIKGIAAPSTNKDLSIRDIPKKPFTVNGKGIFARFHTMPKESINFPLQTPQYSKEQKTDFSQIQSVSLAWPAHATPLVQLDYSSSLVALGFLQEDVLLSSRLYVYEGVATQLRPYDFDSFKDAQSYFREMKKREVLFSAEEVAAFKSSLLSPKYFHHCNEVMARLRLSDKIFVMVAEDTFGARLLAQKYAEEVQKKLTEKYGPNTYEVPILFYLPAMKELHYRYYTVLEQSIDRLTARAYLSNDKLRRGIYSSRDFNILLGLYKEQLPQILEDIILKKNIPDYILQALIDKADIKSWIKEFNSFKLSLLLCFALTRGKIKAVHQILDISHFDELHIFEKDLKKYNPLIFAVSLQEKEIALLLIKNKRYPVNLVDDKGNTALHISIQHKLIDLIEALLERNDLDANIMNFDGLTANDLIRHSDDPDIQNLATKIYSPKNYRRY